MTRRQERIEDLERRIRRQHAQIEAYEFELVNMRIVREKLEAELLELKEKK